MNFIELPDGVCPEDVPDVGGPEYDCGDFSTYPERQGWNLAALLDWDLPAAYERWDQIVHRNESDLAGVTDGWDCEFLVGLDTVVVMRDWIQLNQSHPIGGEREGKFGKLGRKMLQFTFGGFIQTWVLFGILNVALGRPVLRDEISTVKKIVDGGGRKVQKRLFNVRHLFVECVVRFRDELQADPEWFTYFRDCLRTAMSFLGDIDNRFPSSLVDMIIPRPAKLALIVLLNTLDLHQALYSLSHVRADMFSGAALEKEMRVQRGWCPRLD